MPFVFTVTPDQPTAPEPQVITLSDTDALGNTYTVTISSTLSPTTVVGQIPPTSTPPDPFTSYNLSTAGNGWNGSLYDDGAGDFEFSGFAPGAGQGAIVLNQRAAVAPEPAGTVPLGPDVQTLTFAFAKNGTPFAPSNLQLEIFDLTSALTGSEPEPGVTGWRQNYWDAVGFSVAPSSIAYVGTAPYGQGVGAGTLANPYRRADGVQPTLPGEIVSDAFTFSTFPSGSTMQYSNFDGRRGWHFISISGISFESEDCLPAEETA